MSNVSDVKRDSEGRVETITVFSPKLGQEIEVPLSTQIVDELLSDDGVVMLIPDEPSR